MIWQKRKLIQSGARTTLAVIVALLSSNLAHAVITGMQSVATGLSSPIFVTHAPGDSTRLFIAERGGTIRILNLQTGIVDPTPFLTMSGISTTGEGGFLGLAFHPDYFNVGTPGYGKFYVDVTTNSTTATHIREFTVSAGKPERRQCRLAPRNHDLFTAANKSQRRMDRIQP